MWNPKLSYYAADISASRPLGEVYLDDMFRAIARPKNKVLEILAQIHAAEKVGDKELKATLKTKLYSFTPAVLCYPTRKYKDIVSFTGLAPFDFDKLPSEEYAKEFKMALFNEYDQIVACWLSSSRKGVRGLFRIPVCNTPEEYKDYYRAIEDDLSLYHGYDPAPKNAVLPLFISHDPEIIINTGAKIWTKKKEVVIQPYNPPNYWVEPQTDKVYKLVKSAIDKISNNGHPQLRAISVALGGYVAGGYIGHLEAESMVERFIRSNSYLASFGEGKIQVYIKTAKQSINFGTKSPLHL
jgi:hypothetical protein